MQRVRQTFKTLGAAVLVTWSSISSADTQLINRNQLSDFAPLEALGFSTKTGRQAVSDDGRYVVFTSRARNLVADDNNDFDDVFLKDLTTGEVVLLSAGANDLSEDAVISSDGAFVAFVSEADNLVPDDEDSVDDIFLYEVATGAIERISFNPSEPISSRSSSTPSISADGRYVGFISGRNNLIENDDNNRDDVFVFDRLNGTYERADVTESGAATLASTREAVMSRNGRYVAFASGDPNVVSDDTNAASDIFVRDLQMATTSRVTLDESGQEISGADFELFAVSDNGEVVFVSDSALVAEDTNTRDDVYLVSTTPGSLELISIAPSGDAGNGTSDQAAISADGQHVAFVSGAEDLVASDSNSREDIFLRNRQSGTTILVSLSSTDEQADIGSELPSVNANGTQVAFKSTATNLVENDFAFQGDIFVRNVSAGTTARATEAAPPGVPSPSSNGPGELPAMTDSASHIVFESSASDLIANVGNEQTQIYHYNVATQQYTLVSKANNGAVGDSVSTEADVSNDGDKVVFRSLADNLAGDDDNQSFDVFLYEVSNDLLQLISRTSDGSVTTSGTRSAPRINGDGTFVVFDYRGALLTSDTNNDYDIYRLELESGDLVQVSQAQGGGDTDGLSTDPDFSEDGRWVVFRSRATNLTDAVDDNGVDDIFLRDIDMGETILVSRTGAGDLTTDAASRPYISGDGSFVSFETRESLLAEDTNNTLDAYVYDVETGELSLPGVSRTGELANNPVSSLRFSANGLHTCFASSSSNLVDGPFTSRSNIFVRDLTTGRVQIASLRLNGEGADDGVRGCQPSNDGTMVVFESDDGLLVPGDINDISDVFLWQTDVFFFDGFQ